MGDPSSIPELGRCPGEGNGNPLQYSCLENPMDRGAWEAAVHGSQRVGHDWVTSLLWTWNRCDLAKIKTLLRRKRLLQKEEPDRSGSELWSLFNSGFEYQLCAQPCTMRFLLFCLHRQMDKYSQIVLLVIWSQLKTCLENYIFHRLVWAKKTMLWLPDRSGEGWRTFSGTSSFSPWARIDTQL